MSADDWLRWGSKFIRTAEAEVKDPSPSGFVAVHNAWQGAEDSLKAVLVKNSVPWDYGQRGHNLSYLVDLVEHNSLANSSQVAQLRYSAKTITLSGNQMDFKYPQNDPVFFESLTPPDIQNRVGESRNLNNVCYSLVSGAVASASSP